MNGCGRIGHLGPPQYLFFSIYRVHPFCMCDRVTCLTSSIKNFPSLTPSGWFPKILARCARCGADSLPLDGDTALDPLQVGWLKNPSSEGIADHSTGTLDAAPFAGHVPSQRAPSGDMASVLN